MKELPAKVNKLELLKERDIRRFDFRKKIVMDLLRVAAHNARRMTLGVLDKHYRNYRDQVDFLRRLIRCGGDVKRGSDGGITVSLSRLNTSAENQIATAFLNEINTLARCCWRPIRSRSGSASETDRVTFHLALSLEMC
jgi:hypothetical protein